MTSLLKWSLALLRQLLDALTSRGRLAFVVHFTRHRVMPVDSSAPIARTFGLSLDWASLLVALVLATLVRLGLLGNVPW
jgi:hypothetical protein